MVGVALDSLRQMLYYTDEGDDAKIAEISTNGRHHRVVLRQRDMKPRAVVLHDEYRQVHMYCLQIYCHARIATWNHGASFEPLCAS